MTKKNRLLIVIIISFCFVVAGITTITIFGVKKDNIDISVDGAISYYVQNEDGTYKQSFKVPTGDYALSPLTKCENGGVVTSYNNETGTITYSFNQGDKCIVYFYYNNPNSVGNYLVSHASTFTGFNTTDSYGLKRFIGSSTATVNNYICLGDTSTSGSCNANNLYRIIGVVSNDTTGTNLQNGTVKVIKNTSVGQYKWDGGNSTTTGLIRSTTYKNYNGSNGSSTTGTANGYMPSWNESCLNKRNANCVGTEYSLNDTTNSFISSINFTDKIETVSWHCLQLPGCSFPAFNLRLSSDNVCTYNKIGLIDSTDYSLSYNNGTNFASSSYKGWLMGTSNYWNMASCYAYISSSQYEWDGSFIDTNGSLNLYGSFGYANAYLGQTSLDVRPVFYLKSNVEYLSGTGTTSNPIRIK